MPGDHPRVCGKDFKIYALAIQTQGSPPRMRERQVVNLDRVCDVRITPAYAGKTFKIYALAIQPRDHPRVCGKDLALQLLLVLVSGSPPRMRERPLAI